MSDVSAIANGNQGDVSSNLEETQTQPQSKADEEEATVMYIESNGNVQTCKLEQTNCFVTQKHFKLACNELVQRINKDCIITFTDKNSPLPSSSPRCPNVLVRAVSAIRNNSLVLRFIFIEVRRTTGKNPKTKLLNRGFRDIEVIPEVDTVEASTDGEFQYCELNRPSIRFSHRHQKCDQTFIDHFLLDVNSAHTGIHVTKREVKVQTEVVVDPQIKAEQDMQELVSATVDYTSELVAQEACEGIYSIGQTKQNICTEEDDESDKRDEDEESDSEEDEPQCDVDDLRRQLFGVYETINSHCQLRASFVDQEGNLNLANGCFAVDNVSNSVRHQLSLNSDTVNVMIYPSLIGAHTDVLSLQADELLPNPSKKLKEYAFISFKSYNIRVPNPLNFAFGVVFRRMNDTKFILSELRVYCPKDGTQSHVSFKKLAGYINQCYQGMYGHNQPALFHKEPVPVTTPAPVKGGHEGGKKSHK